MALINEKRERIEKDFKINFGLDQLKFTDEESWYISEPSDCIARNHVIKEQIFSPERVIIWDAFAGVGGDTIQFIHLFPNSMIHSIQQASTKPLIDRYDRLLANIKHCKQVDESGELATVLPHPMTIQEFILSRQTGDRVDLLYCDPPWTTTDGKKIRYFSPKETFAYLDEQIFHPLYKQRITPNFICLKIPHQLFEIEKFFPKRYNLFALIPFRKRGNFVILSRN